jgi:hypothetical protein
MVHKVGYYKGEPNSVSQVGVTGREEPISNREDQGVEWHTNELPWKSDAQMRTNNASKTH